MTALAHTFQVTVGTAWYVSVWDVKPVDKKVSAIPIKLILMLKMPGYYENTLQ